MQVFQNKDARTIGRYVYDVQDTCSCFGALKILNIGQIRVCQAVVFVFLCTNGSNPDVLKNF